MTMPSSSRPTRSLAFTFIPLCSRACAFDCSSGPPRQTASQARPLESWSRLAHCWAKSTGWRWTNVARQPTPRRTRDVTPARAESRETASRRGLASRLSPTHTVSNAPDCSAATAMSRRSRALMTPRATARLARIRPNGGAITAPDTAAGASRRTTSRPPRSRGASAATRTPCAPARGRSRAARGDPEVAGERELEASAHRIAIDGSDDRLAAPLGPGQGVAPQLEVGRRQGEELGDVATGAERLAAGAADHHHADRVIAVEAHEHRRDLVAHGHRHRIHLRLAVDPHGGDRPLPLHSQELAHRAISVYRPSRSRRRRIFPDAVFGISVTNTNRRGRLKLASSGVSRQ